MNEYYIIATYGDDEESFTVHANDMIDALMLASEEIKGMDEVVSISKIYFGESEEMLH